MRTTKIQSISLPPEIVKQIEKIIKEEGMTKSELFREALREYIRKRRLIEEKKVVRLFKYRVDTVQNEITLHEVESSK